MVAGLRDPLADGAVTVLAALSAAVAGSVTLSLLLRRLPDDETVTTSAAATMSGTAAIPQPGRGAADRRAFLAWTGTAGAVGVAAALGGRALAGRPRPSTTSVDVVLPRPTATVPGVPGTPAATIPQGLTVEGLSPAHHPERRLLPDRHRARRPPGRPRPTGRSASTAWSTPVRLTFDELLAMPLVEAPSRCRASRTRWAATSSATPVWQGVPLADLLERAGVQPGATQLVGRSVDGWTAGFPTALRHRRARRAMVAVGMNGEPLPVRHGFPARLVVAGAVRLRVGHEVAVEIELTTWEDFDGYWIPRGWSKEGPIKTQSRIDVPRAARGLAAGTGRRSPAWRGRRTGASSGRGAGRRRRLGSRPAGRRCSDEHLAPVACDVGRPTPGSHTLHVRATDGDRRDADRRCSRRPSPTGPRAGTAARSR